MKFLFASLLLTLAGASAFAFTPADNTAANAAAQAVYNKCGSTAQVEQAVLHTLKKRGYTKLTPQQIAAIKNNLVSQLNKRCAPGLQYVGGCKCEGCPDGQFYSGGMCYSPGGDNNADSSGDASQQWCYTYTSLGQGACQLHQECSWDGTQCY